MDDLNERLFYVGCIFVVVYSIIIAHLFGSTISLILNTEINIFLTGVYISIFEFIILSPIFLGFLSVYIIWYRGIRWNHIVFRYNHPLTSITGFIYYLPFVEGPSGKLLSELEDEK